MTAAEARKVALEFNTSENNSQWTVIIEMIKEAAGRGLYEVCIYNTSILNVVRNKLETNGYEVGPTESDRNETMTKISW